VASKIIWTNHALRKIEKASLKKWRAEKALTNSDRIEKSTAPGCKNYVQVHNHLEIGVCAKKNEDNNWLIISAWKRKLY
jgi:hypothetical protein